MLSIVDLHAETEGLPILRGLNLQVPAGEIHAIMGPNGAGKSTLAKVLAGHPAYQVTRGSVELGGVDLLSLDPEERSWAGLFMSFQYPVEIGGISNRFFLREALNSKRAKAGLPALSESDFDRQLTEVMGQLEMRSEFADRGLNEGFSGGEKKRNEILQMALLDPACAILDETDSGLDIDAMRVVACGVKRLMHPQRSLLLITHYQRLLDYIRPHVIHVMLEGRIVHSGDFSLAATLESKGYDWLLAGASI